MGHSGSPEIKLSRKPVVLQHVVTRDLRWWPPYFSTFFFQFGTMNTHDRYFNQLTKCPLSLRLSKALSILRNLLPIQVWLGYFPDYPTTCHSWFGFYPYTWSKHSSDLLSSETGSLPLKWALSWVYLIGSFGLGLFCKGAEYGWPYI